MAGLRHSVQTKCAALLIAGTLAAVQPAGPQAAKESRRVHDQAGKLRQAEYFVDAVMSQVHNTLDFEPVLSGALAPEAIESWREYYKEYYKSDLAAWSDSDIYRMQAGMVTTFYLLALVDASREMNGAESESCKISAESFSESEDIPECLPTDFKSALKGLQGLQSRHREGTNPAAEMQELLSVWERLRLAVAHLIRPDVFTSKAYSDFVQKHRHDSEIATWERSSGQEPVYQVWREGISFAIVERAGTMKIVAVQQDWFD
jgi:hypothetical protein